MQLLKLTVAKAEQVLITLGVTDSIIVDIWGHFFDLHR